MVNTVISVSLSFVFIDDLAILKILVAMLLADTLFFSGVLYGVFLSVAFFEKVLIVVFSGRVLIVLEVNVMRNYAWYGM